MSSDDIQFKLVEITPVMAESFLANNEANRNIRKQKVEEYTKSMNKGFWRVTGEGITLDKDGKLLDGQHRLLAIIAHGKPVTMSIIRNVESGVQQYMDCGAPRRIADNLKMFDGHKNTTALVAIAKALILFDTGEFANPVIDDVRKVLKRYAKEFAWFQANVTKELPRSSYFYAPFVWLSKHGFDTEAAMFLDEMVTLEGLTRGSPVIALTKVLEKKSGGNLKPLPTAMYTFNALRAYVLGEQLLSRGLTPSPKGFDHFNSQIKTFAKRRRNDVCSWSKGCTFKKAGKGGGAGDLTFEYCWLHEHVRAKRES